jgi:hypothetical protein
MESIYKSNQDQAKRLGFIFRQSKSTQRSALFQREEWVFVIKRKEKNQALLIKRE